MDELPFAKELPDFMTNLKPEKPSPLPIVQMKFHDWLVGVTCDFLDKNGKALDVLGDLMFRRR